MDELTIDVEKEFSVAIKKIDGRRVDDITGKSPQHKNADFIFERYSILAEMKCLEKDQISDPSFIEKVSDIYQSEAREGRAPILIGKNRITTENLSQEATRKIADLYRFPITRRIKSADKQLLETKRALKLGEEWKGILILVNEGNTALDPKNIIWSLGETFRTEELPNIDHVIYMTVNMPSEHPDASFPMNVWYSVGVGRGNLDTSFTDALKACWFSHLSSIFGTTTELSGTEKALDMLRNVKK